MSNAPESDQPTRPEALRKLAQLQIDRLRKEEEEDQWISGEELYTEGSSDEDDMAVRTKRRTDGRARKHRRTPGKDGKHRQAQHKSPQQLAAGNITNPPELKLESLSLMTEEPQKAQSQESGMLVTDSDEQIEISWRPKRGSIKLPTLNSEGRSDLVTSTDVAIH